MGKLWNSPSSLKYIFIVFIANKQTQSYRFNEIRDRGVVIGNFPNFKLYEGNWAKRIMYKVNRELNYDFRGGYKWGGKIKNHW